MSVVHRGPVSEIPPGDQSLTSFLGYTPEARNQTISYWAALAGGKVCLEESGQLAKDSAIQEFDIW